MNCTDSTSLARRVLARVLVIALMNPATYPVPLARDTDIYVNINQSNASAPNVLLVLDTSDSMNTPEDWREYPGAYDSHTEYLWNDTGIISTYPGSPVYTENASKISLGMIQVTSITFSGTTGTVTASAHGLSAGWTVTIANASDNIYNGQFTVVSVVDANTFTIGLSTTPSASAAAQTMLANGKTVTSITRSGTTATATVTAHGFSTGNIVNIENASDPLYDGAFTIAVTGPNTFTYTMAGTPSASAATLPMYVMARNPTASSKYGFWSGSTPAERIALWRSAYVYASATESGDPGARSLYRKYSSANWIYWLPAGTAESDVRLRSNSFNRWVGGLNEVSGLRGGISWSTSDFRTYNKCAASPDALLPSTVFAPTNYPLNSGKYLNQRWMRWDRFLNLATVNLAQYAGATATGNSIVDGSVTLRTGYVGWPGDGLPPPNPPGLAPGDPTLAVPARDNTNNSTLGDRGQPIRVYQAGTYSGWTDLAADMGGFNFVANTSAMSAGELTSWRGIYSYPLVLSNEYLSVWLGNRDLGYNFAITTGTSGYFDASNTSALAVSSPGTLGACNPDTGPASAFCLALTGGAVAATCSTTTKTRPCAITGTNTRHFDAQNNSRYYGGTCTDSGAITTSNTGPGPYPAAPADPAACAFSSTAADFYSLDNHNCAFRGTPAVEGTSLYNASQCQGNARPVNTPDTASPVDPALSTAACNPGGASGSYYTSCGDKSDTNQTCAVRFGGACNNNTCNNRTTTSTSCTGGAAGTTKYYRTYNRISSDDYLYHDCVADNGTAGNPSNGYMRLAGVAWNTAHNLTASGATASYTTSAAAGVGADASKNVDMYSVNYLNWKFGPKGPTGQPIGRKTRLQIAKDALATLIQKTNGVRLGLEVFNKTANAASNFQAEGGNIAKKITTMGPRNCAMTSVNGDMIAGSQAIKLTVNPGLQPGDAITITGAGAGGATLSAEVLATEVNSDGTYKLGIDTPAVLTVSGATISLPACGGSPSDTYNQALPDFCPVSTPGCTKNSDWAQYKNRAALIASVNGVVAASRTPLSESLYEAYLYFSGGTPLFGTSSLTAQAGGTISAGYDAAAICTAAGGTATGSGCPAGAGYESPMLTALDPLSGAPSRCQKNHVILITDGGPEDDYSTNTQIKALSYTDPTTGKVIAARTTVDSTQTDTTSGQFESGGIPYGSRDIDTTGAGIDGGYIWLDELAYYMSHADLMTKTVGGVEILPGIQKVTTHTIGFAGANTPVLRNAASVANGFNKEANSSAELSSALEQALAKINLFSPQASSATIPISAFNRSQSADDVYLAFFTPDGTQTWNGTLKKYKFGSGGATCGYSDPPTNSQPIDLCLIGRTDLVGASGTSRNIELTQVDPFTGVSTTVVNPNTVSYWSDVVDGGNGDMGGSGYQLVEGDAPASDDITPNSRKVYTIITDPGPAAESLSTTVDLTATGNKVSETNALLTKARLGNSSMTNANRAMLINYIRGGDPSDAACSDSSSGTACLTWRKVGTRDWAHGDVVHSRPAVLTYDPTTDPITQYIFYLSTDGLLHAVNGYPDDPASGGGKERWAFMVEEALPRLQALKNDAVGDHIEIADGSATIYVKDANSDGKVDAATDKVYLFFGLRRGGQAYYGLDITNIDAPKFLWKISNVCTAVGTTGTIATGSNVLTVASTAGLAVGETITVAGAGTAGGSLTTAITNIAGLSVTLGVAAATDASGTAVNAQSCSSRRCVASGTGPSCSTSSDFSELGQAWSTPAIAKVRGNSNPVLIFGAGYDTNQDIGFPTNADVMGRGIYVVDIETGALVRAFTNANTASMDYSIPADALVVNMDADAERFMDRVYVGDMGGQVWRLDINNVSPAAWAAKRLANLASGILAAPFPDDAAGSGRTHGSKRKLFATPSVAPQYVFGQRFDAVYVGTGDRENPMAATADDAMFMIKDRDTGLAATAGSAIGVGTMVNIYNIGTADTNGDGFINEADLSSTNVAALQAADGWYLPYKNGEKSISSPSVFKNKMTFSTFTPNESVDPCSPAGRSVLYLINAAFGGLTAPLPAAATFSAASRTVPGFSVRGLVPTGVMVSGTPGSGGGGTGGIVPTTDGGIRQQVCYIADGKMKCIGAGSLYAATRVYWYRGQAR